MLDQMGFRQLRVHARACLPQKMPPGRTDIDGSRSRLGCRSLVPGILVRNKPGQFHTKYIQLRTYIEIWQPADSCDT